MNLFSGMLDTLFSSAVATDVTYLYATGKRVTVRAIHRAPDLESNIGGARIKQITAVFEIRRSELPVVLKEDKILLDCCRAFRLMNISQNDTQRAIWTIEAAEEV